MCEIGSGCMWAPGANFKFGIQGIPSGSQVNTLAWGLILNQKWENSPKDRVRLSTWGTAPNSEMG